MWEMQVNVVEVGVEETEIKFKGNCCQLNDTPTYSLVPGLAACGHVYV
jgi:hypothetical protein